MFLNSSFKTEEESLRIKILMQKRIRINIEGCFFSEFLITPDILSIKIFSLPEY